MPDQHTLAETERAMTRAGRASGHRLPGGARGLQPVPRGERRPRHLTNTALRPHDLTWTGFLVLWLLWIWDRLETRRVAENVGISKATLTGVTNTLVRQGPGGAGAQPDATGAWSSSSSTPAGQTLMNELYPEFNAAEAELVAGISAASISPSSPACLREVVTTARGPGGTRPRAGTPSGLSLTGGTTRPPSAGAS